MDKIRIIKKMSEDSHRVISVRLHEDLLKSIDEISGRTNRSRNDLINTLLDEAVKAVVIDD